MTIFPLNNKTHYSILQAYTRPDKLVAACKAHGYQSCGLIDYGNVSGAVEFAEECKKAGIKPIFGCEFEVSPMAGIERGLPVIVIARNLAGWRTLIKLVTRSNHPDCYRDKALLDLSYLLSKVSSDLIILTDNYQEELNDFPHFFSLSGVAIGNAHYINDEDQESYRIVLALQAKGLLKDVPEQVGKRLLTPDEYSEFSTDQLVNLNRIDELCESYSIFAEPKLPTFETPNGVSQIDYLRQLCRDGWRSKIAPKVPSDQHETYRLRVLEELKVIELANLAGYFLIVADFIDHSRKLGALIGPGRGSVGGSLVAYLTNITNIDPVYYGLLFSRFFDASRSYPKHVSFDEYRFVDDWRTCGV